MIVYEWRDHHCEEVASYKISKKTEKAIRAEKSAMKIMSLAVGEILRKVWDIDAATETDEGVLLTEELHCVQSDFKNNAEVRRVGKVIKSKYYEYGGCGMGVMNHIYISTENSMLARKLAKKEFAEAKGANL